MKPTIWVIAFVMGCGGSTNKPAPVAASTPPEVDCSEAYGPGKHATCRVIACDARYATFLGEWRGPFEAYVRELSTKEQTVFRPYENVVTYRAADCLENQATHETLIIGRRVDTYPAFQSLAAQTKQGLLITGRSSAGAPFLRTIDDEGVYDYALEAQDASKEGSIWKLEIPASESPAMAFRVVDERDVTKQPANVRDVTIEMRVGPEATPYWKGVIVKGHHAKQ